MKQCSMIILYILIEFTAALQIHHGHKDVPEIMQYARHVTLVHQKTLKCKQQMNCNSVMLNHNTPALLVVLNKKGDTRVKHAAHGKVKLDAEAAKAMLRQSQITNTDEERRGHIS